MMETCYIDTVSGHNTYLKEYEFKFVPRCTTQLQARVEQDKIILKKEDKRHPSFLNTRR